MHGEEKKGLVFNIQRYTIHDGPGIRTEIFFKGCSLNCPWCSNPEGIHIYPEPGLYPSKCLGRDKCSLCTGSCPEGGSPISFDKDGIIANLDFSSSCRDCLACADACPSGGISTWGKSYTIPELMKIIEKDRAYYEKTGGGVTLSGGEVLLQSDFAARLLCSCRKAGIHTTLESALFVPKESVLRVLPFTDLFITDIKHMDKNIHKKLTGADNGLILENIRLLASKGARLVIRTPVVPGYNDSEENILAIGRFISEKVGSCLAAYQLLPYRKMGTEKCASLGRPYPMGDYAAPDRSVWEPRLLYLRDLIREKYGIPVSAGSAEKLPEA